MRGRKATLAAALVEAAHRRGMKVYMDIIAKGEDKVKFPAWLNESRYYHNRGETSYSGESATMGDFAGLDDLMTEHPRVIAGMTDIFGGWINRFGRLRWRRSRVTARQTPPSPAASPSPSLLSATASALSGVPRPNA